MSETENNKTRIEIDLLGHEYYINVNSYEYGLYKKGESSDTLMGHYSALDLLTPLKKIAKDFMVCTGEVYDLAGYMKEYNNTLNEIKELVKH